MVREHGADATLRGLGAPHRLLSDPENLGDGLAEERVPGDVSMRDRGWGGGLRRLGQLPALLGGLSCRSEPRYPHLND